MFHSSAFGVAAWNPHSYDDGVRYLFLFVALLIATAALYRSIPGAEADSGCDSQVARIIQTIEWRCFTADLELIHDTGGVTNYQQTKDNFAKMFGNVSNITRTLVEGTLEVYPIKDYGAIEVGAHRFCHTENGKEARGVIQVRHRLAQGWRQVEDLASYQRRTLADPAQLLYGGA